MRKSSVLSVSQDLQESAAITGGIAEQLQSEGRGHLDDPGCSGRWSGMVVEWEPQQNPGFSRWCLVLFHIWDWYGLEYILCNSSAFFSRTGKFNGMCLHHQLLGVFIIVVTLIHQPCYSPAMAKWRILWRNQAEGETVGVAAIWNPLPMVDCPF